MSRSTTLGHAYLMAFPENRREAEAGDTGAEGALEAWLTDLFDRAKRAHPGVGLAPETFARGLGARLAEGQVSRAQIVFTDVFLTEACLAGDRAAIHTFEEVLLPALRGSALRANGGNPDLDDVFQTLREELFLPRGDRPPKFALYTGKAPLRAWLRVVVTRIALMRRRSLRNENPLLSRGVSLPPDGESFAVTHALRGRYAGNFVVALRDACEGLETEDRELLLLHVRDRMSIDTLAPRFGLHRATVARRLARVREAIFELTRASMKKNYGVSDSTFDTLCRDLVSNIDLSLRHMLE